MADGSNGNPFLGTDEDLIEDELENPSTGKSPAIEHAEISWDFVAAKLLRDNFILTALELHTELVESGRELPRLRDYFSNPGNFERTKAESSSPTLQRTSSVQTFDSLDFARYSDDGERQVDERMAVLEFELRKAHETIKGLRATLTKAAETELASPEQGDDGLSPHGKEDPIKPLEKRALDFLVNEYLLINNYKLTSVTFSEENGDQDFEDWDDVGLNIPKPPNLLHLFRDYGSHALTGKETSDSVCQIDLEFEDVALLQAAWDDIREKLESKVLELEIELLEVSKEKEELTTQINNSKWMSEDLSAALPGRIPVTEAASPVEQPADNSVGLSSEGFPDEETHTKESPGKDDLADSNVGETSELDDNSTIEANSSEVAVEKISSESEADERNVSAAFLQVLKEATLGSTKDHRIVTEVSRIVADFKTENVVLMLARCLPHIVPHVLLARREELIPLILCTTMLHPDVKERDRLLNILFNLIKKPDAEQRQMILRGCVAFAERVGPTRLEAELLPQCWEQISHKYVERRLLVAEACGVLAPYLPNTIRISLVLSMLQQMLHDDKEEEVREAAVKSLGLLFSLISDQDKYHQGSELLKTALNDSSQKVSTACQHMFLPSFALWALELNWLEHSLIHSLLQQLEHLSAIAVQKATNSGILPMNEAKFSLLVTALQQLVPFLFVSVLQSGPFASRVEDCLSSDTPFIDVSRFPKPSSDLTDVRTIVGDVQRLSAIVYLFEEHISQEWFEPWEQFNWVVNNLIPRLQEIIIGVGLSSQLISMLCRYFFRLCRTFGRVFVDKKIKPKFKELLVVPDDESENHFVAGETALMSCIVPVYAAGVLSSFHMEEDKKQLSQFLQDVLCTLALRQAPLNSLQAAFRELCLFEINHELLLGVLWDAVVHTSANVRCAAALLFELLIRGVSDALISKQVVPALVTLANDAEVSTRTATIPAFGTILENVTIREMLDRVYMQLQTFLDDPLHRDHPAMQIELIKTFARVSPNAEPRFRDEFVLPRLAAMAMENNNVTDEAKKFAVTLHLFDAYSAMSCCFINDQLIQEAMLPGLLCLRHDIAQIAPEREDIMVSMIKEYEAKLNAAKHIDRSHSTPPSDVSPSGDNVKSRMMSRIKDTTSKAHIPNIFTRKK